MATVVVTPPPKSTTPPTSLQPPTGRCHQVGGSECDESKPGIQTEREMMEKYHADQARAANGNQGEGGESLRKCA
jgi:hypothetical protein